ncbi:MAG: DAK2 domain-containing protein [Anaerolineae bacterium]|nr:DAK2 domain-containing protein [Anaerolineae bacterium]
MAPEHPSPGMTEQASDQRDRNQRCSGRTLRLALQSSARWLEAHTDLVNSLNVYPVPDGDTGTNMQLTVRAALEEASHVQGDSAGEILQAVAHGALMGARGNSGVILSQILRGIARALDKKDAFDGADLARALKEGAATAYKGVLRPVEGTMLTVIRESAEAALEAAAQDGHDIETVLRRATEEAERSLARTPSLLPVLREAGVVDAGGQGLVLLLQGAQRFLAGEMVLEAGVTTTEAGRVKVEVPSGEYGYDVQFIMRGKGMDVDAIREVISTMGDSVLVVGDEETIKVHVHSERPGQIIDYGCSLAILEDVVVENMQLQHEAYMSRMARPAATVPAPAGIGIVAVVPGVGLQRVFESLGVSAVVSGGQTMNPSTEELLSAITSLPNEQIIVLPNNANVILAAQQAKGLAESRSDGARQVAVVPTRTIPQGISALLALNYQADLDANLRAMEEAAGTVQTIEITHAVRAARVNGLGVAQGDVIGLLNDELCATGQDCAEVAISILERIHAERMEVITIYYGADSARSEADAFAASIKQRFPAQDVELIDGGQPHYKYIVSAE